MVKKNIYVKKVSVDLTEEGAEKLNKLRTIFPDKEPLSNSKCFQYLLETFTDINREAREVIALSCINGINKIKKRDDGVEYWSSEHAKNAKAINQLEEIISFLTAAGDINLPERI